MIKFVKRTLTMLVVLVAIPVCMYADDPGFPGGGSTPGGEVGAPIDGGASMLVAAAAVYGAKKLKDRKKSK